jgi:hypothetical protein
MNREQIIRMAREAGFDPHDMSDDFTCNLVDIERFAALVAAAEREACAKVCEDIPLPKDSKALTHGPTIERCAAAIRARSEQCG